MSVTRELSDAEKRVIALLCEGLPNKEISRRLSLSEATVKVHCRTIFLKIGAANRTDAVLKWLRVPPDEIFRLRRENEELRETIKTLTRSFNVTSGEVAQ